MPTPWPAQLDPADKVDFYADFGEAGPDSDEPVLDTGETIATYDIDVSEKAASFGLTFDDTGLYAHSKVNGDRTVKMWLSVDEEQRSSCDFVNGIALGVDVSIVTDSVPPRQFKRQWTVLVRHQ